MRDVKLIVPTNKEDNWNIDIDIVNGFPVLLPYAQNNADQRAVLSAYIIKGTIPGVPNSGIDWSGLYTQDVSLINIDNDIKQKITQNVGSGISIEGQYIPLYDKDDDGIHVSISKI